MDEVNIPGEQVTHSIKIAVLLRALRNAFGMSQDVLAQFSGTSRPTINRIETFDPRSPRSNVVEQMLEVFRQRGVDITIGNEDVHIHLSRKALLSASVEILANSEKKGPKATRQNGPKEDAQAATEANPDPGKV